MGMVGSVFFWGFGGREQLCRERDSVLGTKMGKRMSILSF